MFALLNEKHYGRQVRQIENDVMYTAHIEGLVEGRAEGQSIEKIETARRLCSMGLDVAAIAKATGLSAENIEKQV